MMQQDEREFILAGVVMKRLLGGEDTGGGFSLFENRSEGKSQTPVHVHSLDDETIYMIEGELRAIVAGEARDVRAGEAVFLPKGVPHQLMNVSGRPNRYVLLCTPSGFEGFVAEGGHAKQPGEQPAPLDAEGVARMREAAPRFGITLLPGW